MRTFDLTGCSQLRPLPFLPSLIPRILFCRIMATHIPAHAMPRREFTHMADIVPRPPVLNRWERVRHRQAHWLAECVAEAVSLVGYRANSMGLHLIGVLWVDGRVLLCVCGYVPTFSYGVVSTHSVKPSYYRRRCYRTVYTWQYPRRARFI